MTTLGYVLIAAGTLAFIAAALLAVTRSAMLPATAGAMLGNLLQLAGFMLLGNRTGACLEAAILVVYGRSYWKSDWRGLVLQRLQARRAVRRPK